MSDKVDREVSEARLACQARPARAGEMALVDRARRGDTAAFEELYVTHRQQTYNLCLSLCADREEAQDLLQETFVRAYRSLAGFRGEAQLSTWLHRITVNLYRDVCRHRQQAALLPPVAPPAAPDPSAADQVRAALARLQPPYRTVLALRYSQTLSYQEIAEVLHWSLGRVKVTLHRAKQAFKDVYVQCENEP